MEEIRLQKYLAQNGIASRRKCEEYILQGKVKLNGKIVLELGTKINSKDDIVEFENRKIENIDKEKIYILLNKPIGYVTTSKDQFRKRYSARFSKSKHTYSTSRKARYVYIRCFNTY